MDLDSAFLTEVVDLKSKNWQDPKLSGVRKEYVRVMEVVAAFGDKVNNMVDNQREQYMHAYEQHMYDMQKELHSLREKVTEIANDKTRDEKVKQLSSDQVKFRHEALFYDEEAALLRKKIKRFKETLNSVEKDRDWLLKKLREEKRRYNYLKEERMKFATIAGDCGSSMTTISNDSNYSIELLNEQSVQHAIQTTIQSKKSKATSSTVDWRVRLESDVNAVSRDQAMLLTLPLLVSSSGAPRNMTQSLPDLRQTSPIGLFPKMSAAHGATSAAALAPPQYTSTTKRDLAELVSLRAREEAIKDFINNCAVSSSRGKWGKPSRRELNDLLIDAMDICNNPHGRDEDRHRVVMELIAIPETYHALSNLIMGRGNRETQERNLRNMSEKWGMANVDEGDYYDSNNKYEGGVAEGDRDEGDYQPQRVRGGNELLDEEVGGDDDEWTPLDLDKLDELQYFDG